MKAIKLILLNIIYLPAFFLYIMNIDPPERIVSEWMDEVKGIKREPRK